MSQAASVRFHALSPRLIRAEFSASGVFDDVRTFNAQGEKGMLLDTVREAGELVARTEAVEVRYREGSGRFGLDNLTLTMLSNGRVVHPFAPGDGHVPVGGWRRCLDIEPDMEAGPHTQPLSPGILFHDGWGLLDDTGTAVLADDGTVTARTAAADDGYQDIYLFGYGTDYRSAQRDLHTLVGPAPLLSRAVFGLWSSRVEVAHQDHYRDKVIPAHRAERVPLDVQVIDTGFKRPNRWNGWSWNSDVFPDQRAFTTWAAGEGLTLSFNIHPSVPVDDAAYPVIADRLGDSLVPTRVFGQSVECVTFDIARADHRETYLDLHEELGVDPYPIWWYDAADGLRCELPGISSDSYVNMLYAADAELHGLRGFSLARLAGDALDFRGVGPFPAGPWAERRYTVQFTGDTLPGFDSVKWCAQYTIAAGAAGLPYVSHDIGSFRGGEKYNGIPDIDGEEYVRWIQLGVFQPILRLHGNGARLPWEHEEPYRSVAAEYLRLRYSLLPYIYSTAYRAHTDGEQLVQGLWLEWPEREDAYAFDTQYLFGRSLLVAPVVERATSVEAWIPPGAWLDWHTGARIEGDTVTTLDAPLDRIPVLVREGAVVPMRTDYVDRADESPLTEVTLVVAAGADGEFVLYDDDGVSQAHRRGEFTTTAIIHRAAGGVERIEIGAVAGAYNGAPGRRVWTVRLLGHPTPSETTVAVNGSPLKAAALTHEEATGALVVQVGEHAVASPLVVEFRLTD